MAEDRSRFDEPPHLIPIVDKTLCAARTRGKTWPCAHEREARQIAGWIVRSGEMPLPRKGGGGPGFVRCALELVGSSTCRSVGNDTKRPVIKPMRIIVGRARVPEPIVAKRLPQHPLIERYVRTRFRPARISWGRRPVFCGKWIRPAVRAAAVLVVDLRETVEIVVLQLARDGLCSARPLVGNAPIANFDGIVDAVVNEVLVLQQKLKCPPIRSCILLVAVVRVERQGSRPELRRPTIRLYAAESPPIVVTERGRCAGQIAVLDLLRERVGILDDLCDERAVATTDVLDAPTASVRGGHLTRIAETEELRDLGACRFDGRPIAAVECGRSYIPSRSVAISEAIGCVRFRNSLRDRGGSSATVVTGDRLGRPV